MRRSTFKILFYVNKQRKKEGRIPVYARLTVNGKSTFVNCRVSLPPTLWDSKANKAVGKSHEARNTSARKSSGTTSASPTATPTLRPSG